MKYTTEMMAPIVAESKSVSEVCRRLGLFNRGGQWEFIKCKITELGLDTTHFLGKSSHCGFRHTGVAKKRTPEEVLVHNKKRREKSHKLREALLGIGRKYECEECGLEGIWNDKKLVLQVDHRNGDWSDCRPANVRFLCPNCHSQMPTSHRKK